jgi:lysosomal Pro-X carboxypeptidase
MRGVIVLLLLVVEICVGQYHSLPPGALEKVDYTKARFPNHPFFPKKPRTVSPLKSGANCQQFWFEQQLVDHFDAATPPLNTTVYAQRYFVCDGYWSKKSTAPIFFYTGNEADVELYVNHTGLMYELAPDFQALLVFAEHRYFGLSQPFGAETPKYMNYLSMEQALADYAHFLWWYTNSNNLQNAPIVGFGGSYGGMLVSWFRMKYPGSIDGAIAGSAPILAFLYLDPPYDVDSFQIIETQDASPAQGSSAACAPNTRATFSNLLKYGSSDAGRKDITAGFNLCTPLQTMDDVYNLVNWVKSAWDFLTMGNYPYPSDYITNGNGVLPAFPVHVACEYLNISSNSPQELYEAMRLAVGVFYNVSGDLTCYDINQSVNNETLLDGLYWDYLACTEIFIPSGQNGVTDMFWNQPFNLDQQLEACKQQWGVVTKVNWIPETYGGYTALRAASNIFFSNGVLDPWHGGGVVQNMSSSVNAALMNGAAHHLDLMFPNPLDPPDVLATRLAEKAHIQTWVTEALARKQPSYKL